jgi:ankyrin repeat protein
MTENTQTMTEEEMKEEWDAIISTLRKNGNSSGPRVNTEKLLALLKGVDVNSPRFGYDLKMPLLHAILVAFNMKIIHRNDSAKIFRILHECGADGNLPNRFGLTPLYICIASELNMEKKLINILGADLSKEQAHFDYEVSHLDPGKICERMIQLGFKPEEHGRYTRLLFKGKKLKVKRYADDYIQMLRTLLKWNLILPNERDSKQKTPLHHAVRNLDLHESTCVHWRELLANELCQDLLNHGADPLAKDLKGQTALDIWLKKRNSANLDHDSVEELLLNRMADAREIIYFNNIDTFAQTDMGKRLDVELIEIIKQKILLGETRGKRFTRKKEIDKMLAAEGITIKDEYYDHCIDGTADIDMVTFRTIQYCETTGKEEYEAIIQELLEIVGEFYLYIEEEARILLRKRLAERGINFEQKRNTKSLLNGSA